MSKLNLNDADFNLQQVLILMNGLSEWLIRSGVGYSEFSAMLKPIFYQQAIQELERIQQKQTISAVSLLSGLHRKDVTAFQETRAEGKALSEAPISDPISVPARIVGFWVAHQLPHQIPYNSDEGLSFEKLVKDVSTERHPRSVLNELIRLGIVVEENDFITLSKSSFIPDPAHQLSRKILSQNLNSHLIAGLHNLFDEGPKTYLEESIRVDELSAESVEFLQQQSIELWEKMSQTLMELAIKRCQLDENKPDANQRFNLGVYQCEM